MFWSVLTGIDLLLGCSGIIIYCKIGIKCNKMKDDYNTKHEIDLKETDHKYIEPPELRKAGIPPLRRQLNWFTVGMGVIFVVVLIFALYFIFFAPSAH